MATTPPIPRPYTPQSGDPSKTTVPTGTPHPTATTPTPTSTPTAPPAAPSRGSMFDVIKNMFASHGLGDLGVALGKLLANPDYTDAMVWQELYKTKEYNDRFPAMKDLRDRGLGMDEGQYVVQERQYETNLRDAGLPQGFYDSHEDYGKWMLGGVSPNELSQRIGAAQDIVNASDPQGRQMARDYYGIDTDHLLAWTLDPDKAQNLVQKQIRTVQTGATAARYSFALNKDSAEAYASDSRLSGETNAALDQQFASARDQANIDTRLGAIDQTGYNKQEALDQNLSNDAGAKTKSVDRALREQARFAGRGGTGSSSLRGGGI
jgi:hypothetical protein